MLATKTWPVFLGVVAWCFCIDQTESPAQLTAEQGLGSQAIEAVFAQATTPRVWQFPRDHGQHPEFRTEWWYFTGNLKNEAGRRFGYQLTFFRTALALRLEPRASRWAFRDAYLAHFTITDIEAGAFHYDQRLARGALDMAHAAEDSLQVHLGDWSAQGGEGMIHLKAQASFGSISLALQKKRLPVLHGKNGLARKGRQPEDASYYYSMPDLETNGTLQVSNQFFTLSGVSWMDHEFFTGPQKSEAQAWDWICLHLSDSSAVMIYLFRGTEGKTSPFSGGTLIHADGSQYIFQAQEIQTLSSAWWTSANSGGRYPIGWRLHIGDYELLLTTPVEEQELDTRATTGVIYWEGYIEVSGEKLGQPIHGAGYLEMTGYVPEAKPNL